MGLIDRLTDRAVDPLVEGGRQRRQAREAFRAEVIVALRQYSEHIEDMRIAFARVRDSLSFDLLASTDLPLKEISKWASDDLENYPDGSGSLARAEEHIEECGLDGSEYQEPLLVLEQRLRFDLERAKHGNTVGGSAYYNSTAAETRATELDEAWARVRPLLDEALELEAMTYLRSFRHDLRYIVGAADRQLQALVNSNKPEPDLIPGLPARGERGPCFIGEILDWRLNL